jgi:thymidine phosphorylase
MNKTQKRVVVPPSNEIIQMTDEQLNALRLELVDAQQMIEAQIKAAKDGGSSDAEWLIRSGGALAHMRRGLAAIKSEQTRRNGGRPVGWVAGEVHQAFEAVDVLRGALKAYATLTDAVKAFLEDDSDERFAELERLVGGV